MNRIHTAHAPRWGRLLLAPVIAIGLAACGGGGGTPTPTPTPTAAYTVGGTISGLNAGATVQLLDNGGDALSVSANGNFQFATAIQQGGSYAVTVGTQPAGETCSVANATGSSISANVTNVTVTCSPNSYTISGTASGLATGQQVTLLDNGTDSLVVNANGSFQFLGQIAQGGSYQVTVGTQPDAQTCVLANASGSNVMANVSTVTLTCRTSYAYVGNNGTPYGVSVYSLGSGGALNALTVSPILTSGAVGSVAVTPNGQYAYAVGQTSGTLYEYAVTGSSGLTPLSTATTNPGAQATNLIVDPTGHFVFVAMQTSLGAVIVYPIDQTTGVLGKGVSYSAGNATLRLATDPAGKYLYATNNIDGSVSQFSIDPTTGALKQIAPAVTGMSGARDVVVNPAGTYAFVSSYGNKTVTVFSINATTGALNQVGTPTVLPNTVWGLAIDPTGKYLYIAGYGGNVVYEYSVDSNGALTAIGGGSIAAGTSPIYLTVDPTGRYLYASNGGGTTVSQYTIGSGGALTAMKNPSTGGVNTPYGIAVY